MIDQARAFARGRRAAALRDYLAWADLQGSEGARVVETVLPETDDDAVRIMTIHGAKGLEFPITIVSGMTTKAAGRAARRAAAASRTTATRTRCACRHGSPPRSSSATRRSTSRWTSTRSCGCSTSRCTRARDHLVVSVHRAERKAPADDRTTWTHAELLWDAAGEQPRLERVHRRRRRPPCRSRAPTSRPHRAPAAARRRGHDWRARTRSARTAVGAAARVRSATALARDAEAADAEPRRRRPRAGARARATSSCRRGTRAATAPRSGAPCTPCCRPSTSPPAPASTTPRPRRPRPRA